eukprot:TRINITY_DN3857_c0_g1_i3.p1 TRINITY_DN3857_c0_g1~~TRINITY_DN3857_c0_g1_i3.p1  ORF type:complete len:596 (+),score=192.64 TRINITY_DN3857_c0_g1_i3:1239-3026(+)
MPKEYGNIISLQQTNAIWVKVIPVRLVTYGTTFSFLLCDRKMATPFFKNIVQSAIDFNAVSKQVLFSVSESEDEDRATIADFTKEISSIMLSLRNAIQEYNDSGDYALVVSLSRRLVDLATRCSDFMKPCILKYKTRREDGSKMPDSDIDTRFQRITASITELVGYIRFNRDSGLHPHVTLAIRKNAERNVATSEDIASSIRQRSNTLPAPSNVETSTPASATPTPSKEAPAVLSEPAPSNISPAAPESSPAASNSASLKKARKDSFIQRMSQTAHLSEEAYLDFITEEISKLDAKKEKSSRKSAVIEYADLFRDVPKKSNSSNAIDNNATTATSTMTPEQKAAVDLLIHFDDAEPESFEIVPVEKKTNATAHHVQHHDNHDTPVASPQTHHVPTSPSANNSASFRAGSKGTSTSGYSSPIRADSSNAVVSPPKVKKIRASFMEKLNPQMDAFKPGAKHPRYHLQHPGTSKEQTPLYNDVVDLLESFLKKIRAHEAQGGAKLEKAHRDVAEAGAKCRDLKNFFAILTSLPPSFVVDLPDLKDRLEVLTAEKKKAILEEDYKNAQKYKLEIEEVEQKKVLTSSTFRKTVRLQILRF